MSILDDENILIENTKYGIDNPFYLLYNSFDNNVFVYNAIEKLGANKEYYECYNLNPHKWLSVVRDANRLEKDGNMGAMTIDKFDGYLMISFTTLTSMGNAASLLSKKYSGSFTFNIYNYTLIYEP